MLTKTLIPSLLIVLSPQLIFAQEADQKTGTQIFRELKQKDSILFQAGFVTCDYETLKSLLVEDFEFYHDIDGITRTAENFVKSIEEGLCSMKFPPRRELVEGSLKVYPLKKNGELYGAIQHGFHQFYERYEGGHEKLVGIAQFTHLWMIRNNEWILTRVLSYDHKPAGE